MDQMQILFVVIAFISAGVFAGVIARALQSGTEMVKDDGKLATIPALGKSIGKAVVFGTISALAMWATIASALVVTINSEPSPGIVITFATLVSSMTGFWVASTRGYDTLIEEIEDTTSQEGSNTQNG